jgi:hypothetical protein
MNIGKAFSYPFEDKDWLSKVGLAVVITLVPILNFALAGWQVEILRRVERDDPQPIPGWDDLGKKFMDGLMLFLAGLVYALPVILLVGIPLTIMLVPALLAGNSNTQDIASTVAAAGGIVGACLSCLFIIYGLGLSVIYPAIYVEFARKGTFAACFNFREIFAMIGRNAGAFFTAWGVYLGASIGVGIVAGLASTFVGWIPCLGQIVAVVLPFAGTIYTLLVYGHLFGQFSALDTGGGQLAKA